MNAKVKQKSPSKSGGKPRAAPYYALDTRKPALIALGTFESRRAAMDGRNAESRSYGRLLTEADFRQFCDALKESQAKGLENDYFYFAGGEQNRLVYMGEFPTTQAARDHALTKLFGVTKLFVDSGKNLRDAVLHIRRTAHAQATVE